MSALLEQILVVGTVVGAAGFLIRRFFRRQKDSCKCGDCPVRPPVGEDGTGSGNR
jgi:hypothetical protein